MGKKLRNSEKLDLILAELTELKSDIKKLLKHDAAGHATKAKSRPKSPRRPKTTPKQTSDATKPTNEAVPAKPVLVQGPKGSRTAGRIASP